MVYILLAPGFEEAGALGPAHLLPRPGGAGGPAGRPGRAPVRLGAGCLSAPFPPAAGRGIFVVFSQRI